ncbi:MAG: hypothetical protein HYY41_00710 [Chloroflexi bacterium]|nr:hypothetical protein [Chloroflexota bacterium]
MEIIRNLIDRLRHVGVLLLVGLITIVYVALGFVYWQQGVQQKNYAAQITKLSAVVARPLPSIEGLQAEYEVVKRALAPVTDTDAIAMLVGIAEKNGIDVNPGASKFVVPSGKLGQGKVGDGTYQLVSFRNIRVQGDYNNVMAFIADLDSGKTLQTMVLTKLATNEVEVTVGGEDGARRAEFREVAAAVLAMMKDNDLLQIPYSISYTGGIAVNLMGDDPNTLGGVEGFPDIDTTVTDKGYTGAGFPRDGYVLYQHDKISKDNTSQFQTINYINVLTTKYYYTCEADGTVRQFDGANIATATEYLTRAESEIEVVATMDVDIYMTKP